jgi:hypothetical protein
MDLDKLDLLNFDDDNDDDLQDLGLGLEDSESIQPSPGTTKAKATGGASALPTAPASLAAGSTTAAATTTATTNAGPRVKPQTATETPARKRPRSTSPVPDQHSRQPSGGGATGVAPVPTAVAGASTLKVHKPSQPPPLTSADIARKIICSKTRNAALNELLRTTALHDENYALDGDDILKALVHVFEEVIGWDSQKHKVKDDFDVNDIPTMADKFTAKAAWAKPLTSRSAAWAQYCRDTLCNRCEVGNASGKAGIKTKRLGNDDVRSLETILMILRNLSFVAANLRLMAYSPDVVAVLVGCIYEDSTLSSTSWSSRLIGTPFDENQYTSSIMTLASSAISTLINLFQYLDVTGDKLFADKLFLKSAMTLPGSTSTEEGPVLPDKETFGQVVDSSWGFGSLIMAKKLDTKEDVVQDVTKDEIVEITKDYLVVVWSIFPALSYVLLNTGAPKAVTISAMELLQEFVNHARAGLVGNAEDEEDPHAIPTTRVILVYIPVELLHRLAEFLYIPRLNSESLDFADPVDHMVTRVHPLSLLSGYESNIDTEVRDRSLDVLVPLLELDSPRMAARLGTKKNGLLNARVFDYIVPILTTTVSRVDATGLASQLLTELAKAEENRIGCEYLRERIVSIASSNPRVAQLAFNSMYNREISN